MILIDYLSSARFSEDGMDVMERLIYLFRKFNQLKVSNEEYACMKAINFLTQGMSILHTFLKYVGKSKKGWDDKMGAGLIFTLKKKNGTYEI